MDTPYDWETEDFVDTEVEAMEMWLRIGGESNCRWERFWAIIPNFSRPPFTF